MAEWSKAVDLRSTIFGCAGSNPAGSNSKKSYSKLLFILENSCGVRFFALHTNVHDPGWVVITNGFCFKVL